MLLAIDIGNSNIVWALMEGHKVIHRLRTQTERTAAAEAFAVHIRALLKNCGALRPEGAILSSVVPEVDSAIAEAVQAETGLLCMQVTPSMKIDMPICLDEPETLAGDIICGCVGAKEIAPLPLAVVDMGTATTIVVVDAQGQYRGGAIVPGVKLSLSALTAGTSLLPDLHITAPGKVIATETAESLLSGAVYGAAAMVDGLVLRMERELNASLRTVITGGLGKVICPHCQINAVYDEDLVFRGMAILYEKNR